MVVRLSDRVEVDWFKQVAPVSQAAEDEFAVSGIGTIAAASVRPVQPETVPQFVVVSMYARWIKPHPSTRSKWKVGYPDGSAHRIISDLSAFIGAKDPSSHRILAAGDLNMQGSGETAVRERSVWNRCKASALSIWGLMCRTVCRRPMIIGGSSHTTRWRRRYRRKQRNNSTTCSPRAVFNRHRVPHQRGS